MGFSRVSLYSFEGLNGYSEVFPFFGEGSYPWESLYQMSFRRKHVQ